jgi:hypothetical protein
MNPELHFKLPQSLSRKIRIVRSSTHAMTGPTSLSIGGSAIPEEPIKTSLAGKKLTQQVVDD